MKISDLILTANHNLFRNKTRTFLTILAIFIGSFTIILSNAINTGVNDFIDKQVESIGGDGYIEVAPKAVYEQLEALTSAKVQEYSEDAKTVENSTFDDETIKKLSAIDGVDSLNPYSLVTVDYITTNKTDKNYKVTLTILPDDSLKIDMVAGKQVSNNTSDYEIMITEDYVEPLGFESAESAVGQELQIAVPNTLKCMMTSDRKTCQTVVTAKISGVAATGVMSIGAGTRANTALYNYLVDLQYDGLPESQKMAYMATGHIDPVKEDAIRKAFEDEGFTIMTIDDEVGMIRTFFDVILIVFNIFGAIALLAAAIGIINTLFMSVQERTREIGLEKAMGMSNTKIFLSFSCEAILLGFWGSVIGILISMAIGYGANALAHQTFLSDFPTFQLVVFNPVNMTVITGIIMLIAFIAGTAPAYRASKQNPINSLRYE
ncbi:ABC transporter permease [Candidatus Saccharibacteria bacterium]|nr:ABC transporter permease [Candidatus Saccharibacteria bacterium]